MFVILTEHCLCYKEIFLYYLFFWVNILELNEIHSRLPRGLSMNIHFFMTNLVQDLMRLDKFPNLIFMTQWLMPQLPELHQLCLEMNNCPGCMVSKVMHLVFVFFPSKKSRHLPYHHLLGMMNVSHKGSPWQMLEWVLSLVIILLLDQKIRMYCLMGKYLIVMLFCVWKRNARYPQPVQTNWESVFSLYKGLFYI